MDFCVGLLCDVVTGQRRGMDVYWSPKYRCVLLDHRQNMLLTIAGEKSRLFLPKNKNKTYFQKKCPICPRVRSHSKTYFHALKLPAGGKSHTRLGISATFVLCVGSAILAHEKAKHAERWLFSVKTRNNLQNGPHE